MYQDVFCLCFLLNVQTNFSVLVGGCFHSFLPSPVGESFLCVICLPGFKGVSQEVLLDSSRALSGIKIVGLSLEAVA